jgi:hypothetical protein
MDGAVHTLRKDFDEEAMRRAIVRDDGEPFDFGKLHAAASTPTEKERKPTLSVEEELKRALDEAAALRDEARAQAERARAAEQEARARAEAEAAKARDAALLLKKAIEAERQRAEEALRAELDARKRAEEEAQYAKRIGEAGQVDAQKLKEENERLKAGLRDIVAQLQEAAAMQPFDKRLREILNQLEKLAPSPKKEKPPTPEDVKSLAEELERTRAEVKRLHEEMERLRKKLEK